MEEEKRSRPIQRYDLGLKPQIYAKNRVQSWVPNENDPQSVIQVQPKAAKLESNDSKRDYLPQNRSQDSLILLSELTTIESPVKPKNQSAATASSSFSTIKDSSVHNRFRNRETKGVFKLNVSCIQ